MAEETGGEGRSATAVLVLVGIAALCWTAWATFDAARLTWWGARALAVAVPTGAGQDPGSTTHGKPTMEFRLPSGETVRFRQGGFGPRQVGMTAEVAYDPADPAGTATVAGWPLWVSALWGLPVGLGFTVLPLFGMRGAWGFR